MIHQSICLHDSQEFVYVTLKSTYETEVNSLWRPRVCLCDSQVCLCGSQEFVYVTIKFAYVTAKTVYVTAESVAIDTLRNAIHGFQHVKVITCYQTANISMIGLKEAYRTETALDDFIRRLESFRDWAKRSQGGVSNGDCSWQLHLASGVFLRQSKRVTLWRLPRIRS